jgi:adenosine deaminase
VKNWREVRKVELHRHLEGAVRLQTILEGAEEAGVVLPTKNILELKDYTCVLFPMADLATVLKKMFTVQAVLATPGILKRIAYEACRDAFTEGIRVLELRYSLGFINFKHPGLNYDLIHQSIVSGVEQAENELQGKLAVGLIATISRDIGMADAEKTTDFVVNHKDSFVGFDLAGDEAGFKSSLFKKCFDRVKSQGLGITVHAGEITTPGASKLVQESIELLGATRIGHGVAIAEDPEVIDFVKSKNVVLEVCPTSNVYTKVCENIASHPISKLIKAGVRVTLNSDDPQFFGISLSHEYEVLARYLDFSLSDFEKLNEEALNATFIPKEKARKAYGS